jgi:hypothetical protein
MMSEAQIEAYAIVGMAIDTISNQGDEFKEEPAYKKLVSLFKQRTHISGLWEGDNLVVKVEGKRKFTVPKSQFIEVLNDKFTEWGFVNRFYEDTTTHEVIFKGSPKKVRAEAKMIARFTTAPIAVIPPEAPNGKLYDTNVFAAVKVAKYLENAVNSHEEMTYHTYDKLLKDLGRADPLGEFTTGARGFDRKEGALNRLLLDFLGITLAEVRLIARTKQTYQSFKNANRIMVASREEMSKKNLEIITPPESLSSSELPSYESVSPAMPIPTSYEAREAHEAYAREVQESMRQLAANGPRGAL